MRISVDLPDPLRPSTPIWARAGISTLALRRT
jgi:hypothetical protein